MRFKDCESCLVYGSDKKPLSRARVVEVEENTVRLFFTSSKLRNARLKTIVDFYDGKQGLVRCLCELVLKKNQYFSRLTEPWMADGTIIKVYETFQRQKDLRVKVHISGEFMVEGGQFFRGTILNISAGGLFLVTAQAMKVGQFFTFEYRFKDDPCKVSARVIRVQELSKGGYSYGCQFQRLTLEAEADIRNFVYNTQIEKELDRQRRREEQDDGI